MQKEGVKMGNYKEGFLEVVLKPDTPLEIKEAILNIGYYKGDVNTNNHDKRLKALKSRPEKFFQSDYIGWLHPIFMFASYLPWDNSEKIFLSVEEFATLEYFRKCHYKTKEEFNALSLSDEFFDLSITDMRKLIKSPNYEELWVRVSVMNKYYTSELDDFVDFIRPYLLDDYKNQADAPIGHIEDEDGYLNKDIYAFKDLTSQILKSREKVCSGCKSYNLKGNYVCSEYERCKMVFERGYKKGSSKKK